MFSFLTSPSYLKNSFSCSIVRLYKQVATLQNEIFEGSFNLEFDGRTGERSM